MIVNGKIIENEPTLDVKSKYDRKAPESDTLSVGLVKTKDGWQAVFIESKGDKILRRELIGTCESRPIASDDAKIAFSQRLLYTEWLIKQGWLVEPK